MAAQLIDGKRIAQDQQTRLAQTIQTRLANGQPRPGLQVILVGDDPASASYVRGKQKACAAVGIHSTCCHLPADCTQSDIANAIDQFNHQEEIHGILLQLPLPQGINTGDLLERIDPKKDVDGFHPYNLGRLTQRRPLLRPCTPYGIMTLLANTGVDLTGKHAVVVSASNIVGRPMALELLLAKCTVTVCHRFTTELASHIASADILIAAVGRPGIIDSQAIKPGAIVIDVGFTRLPDGRVSGDIDFDVARQRASWITPVPGGVGPMTIASLLHNTVLCADLQIRR